MAKLQTKKVVLPPEGKAEYVLKSVELVDNKFYDPKKDQDDKAKQLEWQFLHKDKADVQVRLWSTPFLTVYQGKKSKCLRIVETLLNRELSPEEREKMKDTDSLVGEKCILAIKHVKSGDSSYGKVVAFESIDGLPF